MTPNPNIDSLIERLRECPFCTDGEVFVDEVGTERPHWFVQCSGCGATMNSHPDREYAITAWNTRASDAEIERLEGSVEFTHEWYAVRSERLKDLGKEHGIWDQMAAIMANGTVTGNEPPTYAVTLNKMRWRAEAAERRAEQAEADRDAARAQALEEAADIIRDRIDRLPPAPDRTRYAEGQAYALYHLLDAIREAQRLSDQTKTEGKPMDNGDSASRTGARALRAEPLRVSGKAAGHTIAGSHA